MKMMIALALLMYGTATEAQYSRNGAAVSHYTDHVITEQRRLYNDALDDIHEEALLRQVEREQEASEREYRRIESQIEECSDQHGWDGDDYMQCVEDALH